MRRASRRYGDFVDLMSQTDKRKFSAGEAVFREGDAPDGFYLLLRGSVAVLKTTADGAQVRLETFRAGDYFGETACALRHTSPPLTIATHSPPAPPPTNHSPPPLTNPQVSMKRFTLDQQGRAAR